MKCLIQHIYKKQYLIKILIHIVLLIFYNQQKQYALANSQNDHTTKTSILGNIDKKKIDNQRINIQANQVKLYLAEEKAYFLGNVIATYNNNNLYADEIYIYNKKINHNCIKTQTFLSGKENIYYENNIINLTGKNIQINIQTQDTDLYKGKFYFISQKIYGTALFIKERKNHRYTILEYADFTTCPPNKKYWKITGSHILYDHKEETLNIWDSYFKIGKIPILYIPYTQISLENKKNFNYYLPTPQYNNKNGIEIKLPYYFNINKHWHGNIITNFIPKKGIQCKNCIQYLNNFHKGIINFDILNNYNNKYYNNNKWLLQWHINSTIQKKWKIKSSYIKINDDNYFHDTQSKYIHTNDGYYLKKKISCKYFNDTWRLFFLYQECHSLSDYIKNIYNTKPQLNIYFHKNIFKLLDYSFFGQITQFKNNNYTYPKTIRLHIEPKINISSDIFNTNFNTEVKLKTTYYQQNNIDFYNKKNNANPLQHTIIRYIPEFKSNAKIILQKKTYLLKKYKQTLEQKFQYLYIPYKNQENIAIYDTTTFQINLPDIFNQTLYTGLDRIISKNQLTSYINTKIYNKNNTKLFNASLGQIYHFSSQITDNSIKIHNILNKKNKNHITWNANSSLIIKQLLGINTNIQYDTKIKTFKSGNAILEQKINENNILQINYRYLNSKCFNNLIGESINPIYQKNITQIGILAKHSINTYWTISGTQFYNVKNKQSIDQTLGIQYHTCCWKLNASYKKQINFKRKKINNLKKYNNKFLLNITLYGTNKNLKPQSNKHDPLYSGILPYQTIF